VHGCCLMPRGQYLAISQLEQVLFLWDVDDDCFVQDQRNRWIFKVLAHWNKSAGRHVVKYAYF
jgi:hypothetical protein